jgi:hypothetical protein
MRRIQADEKAVVEFFHKLAPDCAGRPVQSVVGNDPSEFLCTDDAGMDYRWREIDPSKRRSI